MCRFGDLRLALEADRVRSVEGLGAGASGLPWFDELVPCRTCGRGSGSPRAVALKSPGPVTGFLVSELEDVVTVSPGDLRPLPALVARFAWEYGLRGIALVGPTPAFLFDVGSLPAPARARLVPEGGPE